MMLRLRLISTRSVPYLTHVKAFPQYNQTRSLCFHRARVLKQVIESVPPPSPSLTACRVEPQGRSSSVFKDILELGKIRLSSLVVFTSGIGYVLCDTVGSIVSVPFIAVMTGTLLQAMSANTVNQIIEQSHDAKMKRTRNRPLVTGRISSLQAAALASTELALGSGILYLGCNTLTMQIGVLNHLLYCFVYTPLKRVSHYNTQVGSIVGALPPIMGCTAATGVFSFECIYLGGLLFLWQIPHFLSLAYLCKEDYSVAGYQMLSNVSESRTLASIEFYSNFLILWCFTPIMHTTTSLFFVEVSIINYFLYKRVNEFRTNPSKATARKLFLFILWWLPAVLILSCVHWKRTVRGGNEVESSPKVETSEKEVEKLHWDAQQPI